MGFVLFACYLNYSDLPVLKERAQKRIHTVMEISLKRVQEIAEFRVRFSLLENNPIFTALHVR